jgi:hypothetical protein
MLPEPLTRIQNYPMLPFDGYAKQYMIRFTWTALCPDSWAGAKAGLHGNENVAWRPDGMVG